MNTNSNFLLVSLSSFIIFGQKLKIKGTEGEIMNFQKAIKQLAAGAG